ncbi:hypothetical protein BHM03_00039572 [Ensete ventricosum]|nr:hypothetical protein BHM03_00039572 [Ensete ventricosum]
MSLVYSLILYDDFSGNRGPGEQQKHAEPEIRHEPTAATNLQHGVETSFSEGTVPYSQFGVAQTMAQSTYPYVDPSYGGIYAAYIGQPVIYPQLIAIHQPGVPLPTDAAEEPVYVNAKQYHGILRRRQSRAKAASKNKMIKVRKPYLHESRHLHALKRARGCGGRFLNAKSDGNQQNVVASSDMDQPSSIPTLEKCFGTQENANLSGDRVESNKVSK